MQPREYIVRRLAEFNTILRTLPDERYKLLPRKSLPDIIREEWIEYDNEAARANLKDNLTGIGIYTYDELKNAIDRLDETTLWLRYIQNLYSKNNTQKIILFILVKHSEGASFRWLSKAIKYKFNVDLGYRSVKNWYDTSIECIDQRFFPKCSSKEKFQ